jgi:hypothetical protein
MSSPMAPPEPAIAPKTPNALERSRGSVNVVVSSDSADGASIAPNTPCRARAPTSPMKLPAAPPRAEAAPKPMSPMTKVLRRPSRSARRPPSRSRLPKASVYEVMTHCRPSLEKPRSRCAEGRAMFTIVASSTTISCASPITARASQR